MLKYLTLGLAAVCLAAVAATASPVVYMEDFAGTTTDQTLATLMAYPNFSGSFAVDGAAVVSNGTLVLRNGPNDNNQMLIRPGVGGATTISTLVGADNSGGSYNVGLRVGQNNIVFHPGHGGAALRVEGPGGFGNTNVGFTPANSVLHELRVDSDGTGNFTVTLTDGANPANTFTRSFTNAGSVGGAVALRRSGQPVGVGLYDDLTVGGATESFDTNTNIGTSAVYAPRTGGGTIDVTGGQLVLSTGGPNYDQRFVRSGLKRDHTIIAEVGASNSNGSYNVGLQVGENLIVFHPGYGGAALRVHGPGGWWNTNVGFTPANGIAHELRVHSDGTGNFDVTLTDGANPANTYTRSFYNPNSVGGVFGPRREGGTTGTAFYESIRVEVDAPSVLKAELFDRSADTNIAYLNLKHNQLGTGQAFVSDGVMVLAPPRGSGGANMYMPHATLTGPGTISALVGADLSDGNFNVGLRIGQNQIVFHPGYGGGAFRVEGPGGFGNQNMGFTPANGVLHKLEVTDVGDGTFNITFTDGANPANVYTNSFTNAASSGGQVSLVRKGPRSGVGLFDDFSIGGSLESFSYSNDAQALYPDWSANLNGGYAVVNDGVLELIPRRGTNTSQTFLTDGYDGAFELTALVGADNSNGSYNVGLTIGENNIVFHPGLGGGAFRVEGPGGFGNTNVGFTPANDVLHLLEIAANGQGLFEITLVDGADPTNTFTTSFFNPGSVGGAMGFRRSGQDVGIGLFDNFIVTVPEPATLSLLALGALALLRRRTRSR